MCGIAGGWFRPEIPGEALSEALAAIRHRGPDDSGKFQDGPAALGVRRLAIIDLKTGAQPISNEDQSITVVCNGEIYNYQELTAGLKARGHYFRGASDTEVLAHLYEESGGGMCARLRGMFAFALWDGRNKRLFLARDRFGKKPLYYACLPAGGILFASELKALLPLLKAAGVAAEISAQGIYDYLSVGAVPQPGTIYHNVSALPPGHTLSFEGAVSESEPKKQIQNPQAYWQISYANKLSLSYPEALERTRALIAEAVQLRLRSDVPLGIFLSGGLDSTVLAWEAAQRMGAGLQSFTVAVPDAALDESAVARRTAAALGIQHRVLPLRVAPLEELQRLVRQYDQPFADSSAIPSLAIARLARQFVTVVLNGDGGDEVFAGYRRYLAARAAALFPLPGTPISRLAKKKMPFRRMAFPRRSWLGFASRYLRGAALRPGARYLAWTSDLLLEPDKRAVWLGGPARPTEDWIEALPPPGLSGLDTQLFGDIHIMLLSGLLVKMDMATMAASLEARSPLLDQRLAEFTAALPDAQRLRRWRLKSLLRDAYAGRLPKEVLRAPKRGFEVPLRHWLQHDLRTLTADTLASRGARVRGWLDGDFLDKLLAGTILPERNWAGLVYGLLILELWLRESRL